MSKLGEKKILKKRNVINGIITLKATTVTLIGQLLKLKIARLELVREEIAVADLLEKDMDYCLRKLIQYNRLNQH